MGWKVKVKYKGMMLRVIREGKEMKVGMKDEVA